LIEYLVRHNLPVANIIQSDFIVANEVVAAYYDLADDSESGLDFVPLAHGGKHGGGLLGSAGILAGLSDGKESNPVKRGAWLARKIIAEPPDDPPPNVPELPAGNEDNLSLRERLERHRDQEGCAKCHEGIDPWGLPLEQFDAAGRLKLGSENGAAEYRSTLPDSTNVDDFFALQTYLAEDRIDQVAFSFLKHLSIYGIGRELTFNEIGFLRSEGLKLSEDNYRMRDLVHWLVNSRLFLEK
jgi:hypothetical protein